MSKQLNKLKIIPVNKTIVFWSPIEGDDVLVRTGTIAEGSCFVAGTNVYTRDGSKPIEMVEIGDEVISHNGNIQKVIQTHKNLLGDRYIHKLDIFKTPSIHVTNNHPFWAIKRLEVKKYTQPHWVEVDKLDGSYYIMIPKQNTKSELSYINILDYHEKLPNYEYTEFEDKVYRKCITNPHKSNPCNTIWKIDEDFCLFLGIWFGDGCVSHTKRSISIVSSSQNFRVANFVAEYGERLFGVKPCRFVNDKQNTIIVVFNNVIIAETFLSMFGKGFSDKILPSFIHKLDTNLVKHFIAGLITTDGHVDKKLNISLCMSNLSLVNELYQLVRVHGLDCSACYRPSHTGKQTGYMRFSKESVLVQKLMKYYADDRMERLLNWNPKDTTNTENVLHVDDNTYLRVLSNKITSESPEYVYTLGIENDHSYSVEGVVVQNCFYHSLLYAYSKEYVSLDTNGRMNFVKRLRASMAGKLDKTNWEKIGGGLIAKIPFQENVIEILTNCYLFLNEDDNAHGKNTRNVMKALIDKDPDNFDVYKLVTELIPIEDFEQIILPKAYEKTEDDKINICCTTILEETRAYINEKEEIKSLEKGKINYIQDIIYNLLEQVLHEAESTAYKNYVKGLQNTSEFADTYTISLLSERLKRDIYFLNGKDRMPYNNCSTTNNLKGRKSIIVLWIGENHYETVGRLLPGNRIQREFSHDDPLIQKLYTFLVHPENIKDKYPDLVPYIPKNLRNNEKSIERFTDTEEESSNEDEDSDKNSD